MAMILIENTQLGKESCREIIDTQTGYIYRFFPSEDRDSERFVMWTANSGWHLTAHYGQSARDAWSQLLNIRASTMAKLLMPTREEG